jgi:hypothetical protein
LHTVNDGGMPREKSSGFERSTTILPSRFAGPARRAASSAPWPEVALNTSSAWRAASAYVATFTEGCSATNDASGASPNAPGAVRARVAAGSRGADPHVVAERGQLAGDGLADDAGAEDGDLHGRLLGWTPLV